MMLWTGWAISDDLKVGCGVHGLPGYVRFNPEIIAQLPGSTENQKIVDGGARASTTHMTG